MAREDEFDVTPEEEFVPAVFTRSMDEAEELRQLLEDHGIEAVLGDDDDTSPSPDEDSDTTRGAITHGVAVLVPEMYLDEASEIIADREDADEFEPDDEESDDEDDEDGYFQIEEEDDELYDEDSDEYLDEDEENDEEDDEEDEY